MDNFASHFFREYGMAGYHNDKLWWEADREYQRVARAARSLYNKQKAVEETGYRLLLQKAYKAYTKILEKGA